MHARLSAHTAAFLSVCIGGTIMIILLIGRDVSQLFIHNASRFEFGQSILVTYSVMT